MDSEGSELRRLGRPAERGRTGHERVATWDRGKSECPEEVPPADFALHDGSRMLKFSAGSYVAFMEMARDFVERQVPPGSAWVG